MQYGLFTMPSHPPERSLFDGHRWDLQTLRWADELGFVEAWIGEEQFQKGVRRYLREHAWANATAADFLGAIAAEAGPGHEAAAAAFSSFLDQPGVPMVGIELRCAPGSPRLQLEQERYQPVGAAKMAPARWQVQVCLYWC